MSLLRVSMYSEGIGRGRRWVEEYLEGFHRRCVDYLSRRFVPKLDSPNGESTLATAGITSLLVELMGVGA